MMFQELHFLFYRICDINILQSRWMDPIFAISMGVAAYYLYEQRVGRKPGHTLNELIARKYQRWRNQ